MFKCLAFCFAVAGCTTVDVLERPPDVPRSYIGFVRVRDADPAEAVRSRGITMGGAWFGGSGAGVGFVQNRWVTLDGTCEVIILIKNDAQADKINDLLRSSDGWREGTLCSGEL